MGHRRDVEGVLQKHVWCAATPRRDCSFAATYVWALSLGFVGRAWTVGKTDPAAACCLCLAVLRAQVNAAVRRGVLGGEQQRSGRLSLTTAAAAAAAGDGVHAACSLLRPRTFLALGRGAAVLPAAAGMQRWWCSGAGGAFWSWQMLSRRPRTELAARGASGVRLLLCCSRRGSTRQWCRPLVHRETPTGQRV